MDTYEQFVKKAKSIHGNRYSYIKPAMLYKCRNKIDIICKSHGIFSQMAQNHLQGKGCRLCGIETVRKARTFTFEEFVSRALLKHGKKYSYSKAKSSWADMQRKIPIVCSIHGKFEQNASAHLSGKGCKRCACLASNASNREDTSKIFTRLIKLHPKLEFPDLHNISTKKISYTCKDHGSGSMVLSNLLSGKTCQKCAAESRGKKQAFTTKQFVSVAKHYYGSRYSYSKVEYVNAHTEVTITCKDHGDFQLQPMRHINKNSRYGCPKCTTSYKKTVSFNGFDFTVLSKSEYHALNWIFKHTDITPDQVYDWYSKKIPMFTGDFLGLSRYYPDFYIPSKNLIVEVKSVASAGIRGTYYEKSLILFRRLQKRAATVTSFGYEFKACIMTESGSMLKLPSNWKTMKYSDARKLFNKRPQGLV